MSEIKKNSSSRRSSVRISSSLRIAETTLSSKRSCFRYIKKGFSCLSLRDGRCSECIRSGVEKSCNAEMTTRIDKALKEQKAALRRAQADVAEASARMMRL